MLEMTVPLGSGWGHGPWFPIVPLVWLALLVGAFLLFRRRDHRPIHSAEGVLAERYAKGEISADEYRERLSTLRRDG